MNGQAAEDFALRLGGLINIGRLQQGELFAPLLAQLQQERETFWRLVLLQTLFVLPCEDKITPLLPLLAEDLPGDELGFFLCGLIWFMGNQGERAIEPLIEQVLAKPARARRIKDGLLAEAFFLAAGGNKDLLNSIAAKSPVFYRFCSSRLWPKNTIAHYSIYPHPDYLLQIAQKHGLSRQQFKTLFYRPRKKRKKGIN